MSAKIITFDVDYIANQMRNIEEAHNLTEEAMGIIKKANQHRNWKCYEAERIENSMSNMLNKLSRLNTGIIGAGNALGKEFVSFTELENRAMNNANILATDLQNKYGFSASIYGQSEKTQLSTTLIPNIGCTIGAIDVNNNYDNGTDAPTQEEMENLLHHLEKSCEALWNGFSAFIRNGGGKIPDLVDAIDKTFSNLKDDIGELAGVSEEEFKQKFLELLSNSANNLGETGAALGDAIVYGTTESLEAWLKTFGIDISQGTDFIQNSWEIGKQLVEDGWNAVTNFFASLLPWG